jgi:hypothetical protein
LLNLRKKTRNAADLLYEVGKVKVLQLHTHGGVSSEHYYTQKTASTQAPNPKTSGKSNPSPAAEADVRGEQYSL